MAGKKASEKGALLERRLQALDLRKRGLSYRAIGDKLGIDFTTAYKDVMAELKRLAAENHDKADELRAMELERLDMLIKGLEPMATVGNPGAVNSYIKCMERRAKLLGLDAPTKVQVDDWRKEAQAAGVDDARLFEEMVNAARQTIAASAGTHVGGGVGGGEETGEQ